MRTLNPKPFSSQDQHSGALSSFESGRGGAELTLHADRGGVGGASAPHPCLTDNNSINVDVEAVSYTHLTLPTIYSV